MKLPLDFIERMKKLLDNKEYKEFIETFDMPRYYGLRVNSLKISKEEFLKISPFKLEKVPWAEDGFYYKEEDSPGRHPYYHAGLYYIQEPSAMLPTAVLGARPGEHVLDLCAAPGGKTVQIAASMDGKGIIVANDINFNRTKVLVKNIELYGVRNAIVTNESPERLAEKFTGYFDRILVDAPCSGEGMFRKSEDETHSWEKYNCETCSLIQKDILKSVDIMLKPGGTLVYSTCTFAPEEDEQVISDFLNNHKNYEVIDVPRIGGIEGGRPYWSDGNPELLKTARLWPHRVKGEGHFVAVLRKGLQNDREESLIEKFAKNQGDEKASCIPGSIDNPSLQQAFNEFADENLNIYIDGFFSMKGKYLYFLPETPPDLGGLKVVKHGWFLGELVRGRFEPSHSLVVSLKKEDIRNSVDYSSSSREIASYLRGETLIEEGRKGYTAVCVDGHTVGWAKQMGDMLKNLYPRGWRRLS